MPSCAAVAKPPSTGRRLIAGPIGNRQQLGKLPHNFDPLALVIRKLEILMSRAVTANT